MDSALILRLIVIGIGIIMLSVDFLLYCRKRLIEKFSFAWGIFSIILILSGAVSKFNVWSRYLSLETGIFFIVLGLILICLFYSVSLVISDLVVKNQELAMQVSLLNCEAEKVLKTLNTVTGKDIMDNK